MDLRTLNAYSLYEENSPRDTVERPSEGIRYPKAVYTLETPYYGVAADNTDAEWNGFARPFFCLDQRESLVKMMNQVDEVEAKLKGFKLIINNDASGEREIVVPQDNFYELSGWSFYKFDNQNILDLISIGNWEIDDVANLIIWLEANDAGDYESYLNREITPEIDELRRLAYVAIHSIMRTFNVSTVHGIVEQHDIFKTLFDEYKN